jgi:hypothetical protein
VEASANTGGEDRPGKRRVQGANLSFQCRLGDSPYWVNGIVGIFTQPVAQKLLYLQQHPPMELSFVPFIIIGVSVVLVEYVYVWYCVPSGHPLVVSHVVIDVVY